jgi:hypothetical protein
MTSLGRWRFVCVLAGIGLLSILLTRSVNIAAQTASSTVAMQSLSRFPPIPFVAEYEERVTSPKGEFLATREEVGLRSDGRQYISEETFNTVGRPSRNVRHVFHPDGALLSIWDQTRVVVSSKDPYINPRLDTNRLNPDTGCTGTFSGHQQYRVLGETKSVLGRNAQALRAIGDESSGMTVWMIKELNCLVARREVHFPESTSIKILTGLQVSPDENARRSKFASPIGYSEVRPTEAYERIAKHVGGELGDGDRKALSTADERWSSNRVATSLFGN